MGWTNPPRTWVAGEVVTATIMNTHLKDQLSHLKTAFDDTGKLAALSSSYLGSLDGASGVHGLVPLSGVPPWTDVTGGTLSAGSFTKTAATGWGTGWARSVTWRTSPDDTRLRWTVPAGIGNMYVGLSFDFSGSEAALDYCFKLVTLAGADSKIIENNSDKATGLTFSSGDVLDISVVAGTVKYYKNSTLLYTSLTSALTTLYACFSVYTNGQTLSGLEWEHSTLHTAAKSDFTAGKLVLPVGTDKFAGYAGAKRPGSLWVEGDYLHHVSDVGVEWRFLGTYLSTPGGGAIPGSIWVETTGYTSIHYIDADGDERWVASSSSPHTDAAAVTGSVWVETYLHAIAGSGIEYQGHMDTHTDGTTHGDTSHTDTHDDTHGDVTHIDGHGDTYTNHTDVGHADVHADVHYDTTHTDTYSDSHGDVSHSDHSDHGDVAHDDRPESLGI